MPPRPTVHGSLPFTKVSTLVDDPNAWVDSNMPKTAPEAIAWIRANDDSGNKTHRHQASKISGYAWYRYACLESSSHDLIPAGKRDQVSHHIETHDLDLDEDISIQEIRFLGKYAHHILTPDKTAWLQRWYDDSSKRDDHVERMSEMVISHGMKNKVSSQGYDLMESLIQATEKDHPGFIHELHAHGMESTDKTIYASIWTRYPDRCAYYMLSDHMFAIACEHLSRHARINPKTVSMLVRSCMGHCDAFQTWSASAMQGATRILRHATTEDILTGFNAYPESITSVESIMRHSNGNASHNDSPIMTILESSWSHKHMQQCLPHIKSDTMHLMDRMSRDEHFAYMRNHAYTINEARKWSLYVSEKAWSIPHDIRDRISALTHDIGHDESPIPLSVVAGYPTPDSDETYADGSGRSDPSIHICALAVSALWTSEEDREHCLRRVETCQQKGVPGLKGFMNALRSMRDTIEPGTSPRSHAFIAEISINPGRTGRCLGKTLATTSHTDMDPQWVSDMMHIVYDKADIIAKMNDRKEQANDFTNGAIAFGSGFITAYASHNGDMTRLMETARRDRRRILMPCPSESSLPYADAMFHGLSVHEPRYMASCSQDDLDRAALVSPYYAGSMDDIRQAWKNGSWSDAKPGSARSIIHRLSQIGPGSVVDLPLHALMIDIPDDLHANLNAIPWSVGHVTVTGEDPWMIERGDGHAGGTHGKVIGNASEIFVRYDDTGNRFPRKHIPASLIIQMTNAICFRDSRVGDSMEPIQSIGCMEYLHGLDQCHRDHIDRLASLWNQPADIMTSYGERLPEETMAGLIISAGPWSEHLVRTCNEIIPSIATWTRSGNSHDHHQMVHLMNQCGRSLDGIDAGKPEIKNHAYDPSVRMAMIRHWMRHPPQTGILTTKHTGWWTAWGRSDMGDLPIYDVLKSPYMVADALAMGMTKEFIIEMMLLVNPDLLGSEGGKILYAADA